MMTPRAAIRSRNGPEGDIEHERLIPAPPDPDRSGPIAGGGERMGAAEESEDGTSIKKFGRLIATQIIRRKDKEFQTISGHLRVHRGRERARRKEPIHGHANGADFATRAQESLLDRAQNWSVHPRQ